MGRQIDRLDFADFLKRLAAGTVGSIEWHRHIVTHYHDELLEDIRVRTVRLVIGREGGIQWSDSELCALQQWSRELRGVAPAAMIAKDDMMGVLLDACPSFAPRWQAFLDEWRDRADDLPLYVALGDFARHLIGLLEQGNGEQLVRVFRAVERLHLEGGTYVREAATVGLLENLQNLNLHSRTRPEQFAPYLGPESACSWAELNRFWSERG